MEEKHIGQDALEMLCEENSFEGEDAVHFFYILTSRTKSNAVVATLFLVWVTLTKSLRQSRREIMTVLRLLGPNHLIGGIRLILFIGC